MEEKINKTMLKLAQWVVKWRLPIVLIVLALTVFFGYYAAQIKVDANIVNSLPDSDPAAKLYKEVGKKYQGNTTGIIILQTDNVFRTDVLEDIRDITDSLMAMNGITHVTSLTNIIDIRTSEWGMEIGRLVDEYDLPDTPEELAQLRDRVFSKDMYRGIIVSEDSTTTSIIATYSPDVPEDSISQAIKNVVSQIPLRHVEKIYYAGMPFMMLDTANIIFNDLKVLLPITSLIIIIILALGFRSVRGVVLPLLNVGIAIIWTMGLMVLTGHKLTMISDTIPGILLALGSAYTIHVLNRLNEINLSDRQKALVQAMAFITIPVFLAYITTAFGFTSFIFGSYLTMIRDYGIFTAIGITFSFLLAVIFTPAVISLFSAYRSKDAKRPQETRFVNRVLVPLSIGVTRHPKRVIAIWLGLTVIFFFGIFLIRREVDMVDYFREGSPSRVAQEILDSKLGGSSPIYMVFDGDVQDPQFLKKMFDTEQYMKEHSPYVSYTFSVADLIAQMNEAMGEGYRIPDERAKIEQLWMMIEGEDVMEQLVSPDLDEAIIQARFAKVDSKAYADFVKLMDDYIKRNSSDKIKMSITGLPHTYTNMDRSLIVSQYTSLVIAIILMLIIVSLTLWSLRCGLMAIVPLIITIIISYGFMGYVGITLNVATVLVASITLGVGIDYSVHIVSHYRAYRQSGLDVTEALKETIRTSGNAIFINLVAVAAGFFIFIFSKLVPLNQFAILMSLSMVVAGLAAVTLLPAIIFTTEKQNPKNTEQ